MENLKAKSEIRKIEPSIKRLMIYVLNDSQLVKA